MKCCEYVLKTLHFLRGPDKLKCWSLSNISSLALQLIERIHNLERKLSFVNRTPELLSSWTSKICLPRRFSLRRRTVQMLSLTCQSVPCFVRERLKSSRPKSKPELVAKKVRVVGIHKIIKINLVLNLRQFNRTFRGSYY